MNVTRRIVESARPWVQDTSEDAIRVTILDSPELMDSVQGFDLWLSRKDQSLTPSLMYHGFWESWITTWVINHLLPNSIVLDIGANCGYYTMLFERLVGRSGTVVAYEANPEYVELLRKTRAANNAYFNIESYALSDQLGQVDLHIPGDLTGSASIVANWKDDDRYLDRSITVATTTLDHDFKKGIFQLPDLVKMDVEGAEELIFNGGYALWNSKDAPVVMLEYTPGAYSEWFNEELFAWGEVTYINTDGGESPVDDDYLKGLTDWSMLVVRKHK